MKKIIALFLVTTFMGMNCAIYEYEKGEGINAEPGQEPGAKLVIQKKDGEQIRGELIAVKENSLLLKEHESGADESVDVSDINKITIVRKSWGWKGILLIGGGLGLIAGISQAGEEVHGFVPSLIDGFIWGAIIAAIVGAAAGTDKTIQFEGKSDSKIKEILEDLRTKARVPDFQ
jgi:hypothetical protein